MMERHINHLYGLLGSSTNRQMGLSPEITVPGIDTVIDSSGQRMIDAVDTPNIIQSANQYSAFTTARPQPPIEVIEYYVDVYRTKVHLQPLPLFRLERLADQLLAGPQFVLWSFLSLMLTISSHDFFKDQEHLAEDFYGRSSEDITMRLALDGELRSDVTLSLCLIAMKHIKCSRPAQAWMAIGNASRLYAMRALLNGKAATVPEDDSEARGYWSVFILERLFLPCVSELSATRIPNYPQGASLPPPPSSSTTRGNSSNVAVPEMMDETPGKDIGINGYCLRIISIWGKIRIYLHRLSQGEVEKPWLADSTHTKLGIELIDFEAQHSNRHLLANVAFTNRSATEINQQSEYWNPWMTTEILWHAAQAILNHPFLHLVVLRSQKDIPQSCVFLQQKVDMALYHVSWLFRILQFSEGLMVISNPIIGDAIAASATILWLFQFTRDAKIAQRTRNNLETCDKLLSAMADMWPHIFHKLITLRKLRILADQNRSQATHQETTISFKPELFWDLLVPTIQPDTNNALGPDPVTGCESDSPSKMRLKSHFIDRLSEEPDSDQQHEGLGSAPLPSDSLAMGLDHLEQFDIEELSRGFIESDFWNMVH
ncbi:hypothetical protein BDV41DRAFT_562865 [Aspergillus transmontanensis]|uniref:Transcription factor domain-containing protein n=1 Tax=Aspergillus transmontanensis TaxID=1034304 RepID=A0A5N6W451_9EURO|nr:hypothetical protein BDV41DRAFT_562865 [Aspergillus transmontanensis]